MFMGLRFLILSLLVTSMLIAFLVMFEKSRFPETAQWSRVAKNKS